eukprot:jgi/Mesvir1/16171/Mv08437-RA.1
MEKSDGSRRDKKRKSVEDTGEAVLNGKGKNAGRTQKPSLTAEERLALLGEAFLSNFDDDGPRKAKKKKNEEPSQPAGLNVKAEGSRVANNDPAPRKLDARAAAPSSELKPLVNPKQALKLTVSPGHATPNKPAACLPATKHATKPATKPATTHATKPATTHATKRPQDRPRGTPACSAGDTEAAQRRLRQEWKLFMSSKPTDILKDAATSSSGAAAGVRDVEDAGPSSQEFRAMRREVELLGAKGFELKQRKAWHASTLEALGAKPPKRYRLPLNLAMSYRKHQLEREQKAKEEAIATGMYQPNKKASRKASSESSSKADRGLKVGMGGRFVNGILMVKDPSESSAKRPDTRLSPLRKKSRGQGKKGKTSGKKRR